MNLKQKRQKMINFCVYSLACVTYFHSDFSSIQTDKKTQTEKGVHPALKKIEIKISTKFVEV